MIDSNTEFFITGGFGFLGSSLVRFLNSKNHNNIVIFENDTWPAKWKNLAGLRIKDIRLKNQIFNEDAGVKNRKIIVLGATSGTNCAETVQNYENNVTYPCKIIGKFTNQVIFASSASIYGNSGDFKESNILGAPTNFYGYTKSLVDGAIDDCIRLGGKNIYSLRLFNCFGDLEGFKNKESQSPIYKWLSYDFGLGGKIEYYDNLELRRDFIYVEDVCKVIYHVLNLENDLSGIYNVGTGIASGWGEVANLVKKIRNLNDKQISQSNNIPEFVKSPKYQRFTKSENSLLRGKLGYKGVMTSLEDGIQKVWEKLNDEN